MLPRDKWLDLARDLDWDYIAVQETAVFPEEISGKPWLSYDHWKTWDEPYKTTYSEYVNMQALKGDSVEAVREAVGGAGDLGHLHPLWANGIKLHSATLALAEFAAVIGNLRAARFGRTAAWRSASLLGALDECRHTEIPLLLMHEAVRHDPQFDWTHKFYHSNNWVAIAARHLTDELLVGSNPIEFAIATHFVFETGFTNLQFVGLSSLAHWVGDTVFEKMTQSIQSDEARHAQIGYPVLSIIAQQDPEYAQYLVDKWFWRSWLIFSIITGFCMDYFTPLEKRKTSFKEFVEEWVIEQYLASLEKLGLRKPWYWDYFLDSVHSYHHQVYASAYSYRSTVWFQLAVPSPEERAWLKSKYPETWRNWDQVWSHVDKKWSESDIGNDFAVHGSCIIGFCDLCQLVLCGGNSSENSANTLESSGKKYIFCSKVCRWIFEKEIEKYGSHENLVQRVLLGKAPSNLLEMLRCYFGLTFPERGKDLFHGDYSWINRSEKRFKDSTPNLPPGVSEHPSEDLIPLYGFLEGDTLGLLILAYRRDTVAVLIEKVQQAAHARVPLRTGGQLLYQGKILKNEWILADAGIQPLERVDVRWVL